MRVIYTDQSIDSLEELLEFVVEKQKFSPEQASRLKR